MGPSLADGETGADPSDGTSEAGDESGEPAPDCLPGAPGCPCTAGGACDAGLVCGGGFCMPQGCTPGTLNCSCDQGTCAGELDCKTSGSGDVCVEPVDGADSGDTTGEDSCEPQGNGDDCNGNGVRDTCDPKAGEGTCTLWGYASDSDDVDASDLNGDIRFAFVENRDGELIVGLEFYEPLDFSDANAIFEFYWHFDIDTDASTGTQQVAGFGGDFHVRVDLDTNQNPVVRLGDGEFNSHVIPGVDVDLELGGRLLVTSLDMPAELMGVDECYWLATSDGIGGDFQQDSDKTNAEVYHSVAPIDEDCDGNGLFDRCEDFTDLIGWGSGVPDGVPDSCQVDEDNDGIDDACQ